MNPFLCTFVNFLAPSSGGLAVRMDVDFSMYRALGTQWATSVLGFAVIAMIPIPFAFYKYGPRVRERSKFAQVL